MDAFCGIDLDHCRTIETGEIAPWALLIIAALGSYSEISPSGEGVHIWVQGTLPPKGRKKGSVEMYVWGRFLTMTGQHIQGTPHAVEARQDALTAVHAAHVAPPPPSSQHTGTTPLIEDA